MEVVPLREIVEERFDRLEVKVDKWADHEHRESVSWRGLMSTLIPLGGGLVWLIFALS